MLSMYTYVIFSKKSYFHDSVPLIVCLDWVIVAKSSYFGLCDTKTFNNDGDKKNHEKK